MSSWTNGQMFYKIWRSFYCIFLSKGNCSLNVDEIYIVGICIEDASPSQEKSNCRTISGVNFINIKRARFSYEFWRQSQNVTRKKDVRTKNSYVKLWWNWRLVSISSTFGVQIFSTNVFFYVNVKKLPRRRSYEKRARMMLMKLTPGVDFINVFARVFCMNVFFLVTY